MQKHYKPGKFSLLGNFFKYNRIIRGITQKEIATALGIPYQDYQKYEYGIIIPKVDRYIQICNLLNLKIDNSFYHLTKDKYL